MLTAVDDIESTARNDDHAGRASDPCQPVTADAVVEPTT
jgi:hypothetical protein